MSSLFGGKRLKLTLAQHIVAELLVPLVFIGTGILFAVGIQISNNYVPWTESIRDTLIAEELTALEDRAEQRAQLASSILTKAATNLRILQRYAVELYEGDLWRREPYESYYAANTIYDGLPPGGWSYDAVFDRQYNLEVNGWYMEDADTPTFGDDQAQLDETSHLDNAFRAMYLANNGYAGAYFGTDDTGMWRHYPYIDLSDFPSFAYTCAANNQYTVGYDPRCRGWYVQAVQEGEASGGVVYTEPYTDAASGLVMITVAGAVYADTAGTGATELVGVVGIDLSIDSLSEAILSTTILEGGYAYMVDSSGNTVIHPAVAADVVESILTVEFPNSLAEQAAFEPVLDAWLDGGNGTALFVKDGADWQITYLPIEGVPYFLALVVPQLDVEAPAESIEATLDAGWFWFVGLFTAFGLAVVALFILVSYNFIQKTLRPIRELSDVLTNIAQLRLDVAVGEREAPCLELEMIYKYFGHYVTAIRAGNTAYYGGDLSKALQSYIDGEALMEETGNKRGVGICKNNIGSVYFQMASPDDIEKAELYYMKAIVNAGEMQQKVEAQLAAGGLSDEAEQELYEQRSAARVMLAKRMTNLGVLMMAKKDWGQAEKLFGDALALHMQADNVLGMAQVNGRQAEFLVERGRAAEAAELARQSFETILGMVDSKQLVEPRPLYYAAKNVGVAEAALGNTDAAIAWFNYVLSNAEHLDAQLLRVCVAKLRDLYALQGRTDMLTVLSTISPAGGSAKPKSVLFILDYSGSMHHRTMGEPSRINVCVDAILSILKEDLNDNDEVAFTLFNHKVIPVFDFSPLKKKAKNLLLDGTPLMSKRKIITALRKPNGGTAWYDALLVGFQRMKKLKTPTERWVIALTDGADGTMAARQRKTKQQIRALVGDPEVPVNLITITVGNEADIDALEEFNRAIERCGDRAMHISALDKASIDEAFKKASSMMTEVTLESF